MKYLVLPIMLCAMVAGAATTRQLSLEAALVLGMERSNVILASARKTDAAFAQAAEVRTSLLPSVKLEAGYRRLSDVDPFRVTVPFAAEPITISPVVVDNYTMRLSVAQPLFTGFRLSSNLRAAELTAEAVDFERRADEANVALAIKTSYWLLFQTLEMQRYVTENVGRLENHVKDTERLMRSGLATKNDLLRIEVQLSAANLARIDADHDVQVARMNLNNAIGLPLDETIVLTSSPSSGPPMPGDMIRRDSNSELVNEAIRARPDLQSQQLRVQAGEANVMASRSNWWPQLFLTGNLYHNRPNARYMPTRDEFKSTWDIGVQLQLDLWNWGATGYQTDRAEATLQQSVYTLDQMKDNVSLDVTRYYLKTQRSREKVQVATLGVEQADENLRTIQELYRNGLATSSDLVDADTAVLQARTSLTGALVELEITRARLDHAVGAP